MAVLGVEFTKIQAERKAELKGKINISNNVAVTEIKKHGLKFGDSESVKISFKFTADYNPNIGNILIEGDTIVVEKPEKIKETLDMFKKNKKLPDDVLEQVMNSLLSKCNVEALVIGREVGLPPTLNMPKVKAEK